MDEARCKDLNRVVTGEELYVIDNIESLSFSCDACGIPLNPCSYKKEVNLQGKGDTGKRGQIYLWHSK